MQHEKLAQRILQHLDTVVLQRGKNGKYTVVGDPPPFYGDLFPPDAHGPCCEPWQHSFMLEFFYQTAEEFFAAGNAGVISSGTWEEEGICELDRALVAEAMTFDDAHVITVRMLTDIYAERVALLNAVRVELLERCVLDNDLEKYKEKSTVDALTKVFNRMGFMDNIPGYLENVHKDGYFCAVIMLDIDHFKKVNDTFGHQSGDLVLSDLGQILKSSLRREVDMIARYGGEEFVLFVQVTSKETTVKIAEKVRDCVAKHHFGPLPRITASFGCTLYVPGENVEAAIARADEALYEAKHNGRNRVRVRWAESDPPAA
ncbi:MAG: GGDEF domain-containing protein [Desulfovibrio sp.]|nr:GGDEF domain-containing protein [Desulfovibrio sp.]